MLPHQKVLQSMTHLAFPDYHQNMVMRPAVSGQEVLSNLPLQMLLYFNLFYTLIWTYGMASVVHFKMHSLSISTAYSYVGPTLVALVVVCDGARLYLGYSGNLKERVPELAGCFLITLCPILPICIYLVGIQQLQDVTLPIEVALNALYLLLLVPEVVLTYQANKALIRHQAAQFFLNMDEDQQPLSDHQQQQPQQKDMQKTDRVSQPVVRQTTWMNETT